MRKTLVLLMFLTISNILFAQQKEAAEKLVQEGITYHDKGDYEGAITRYNTALELDKDNLIASAEKALSLLSQKKYDECVAICKMVIEKHPGEEALKTVYVTYGNALDELKKPEESIRIFDEGIKQFPDCSMLYFNKAVTLASVKKHNEALECGQKSIQLSPNHAGSHNLIARIQFEDNHNIPALLAIARFLIIEPQSQRAKSILPILQKIMQSNVKQTGDKTVTINLNPSLLADTTGKGKTKENSFTTTELLLSLESAMDFDQKNKNKTEVEKFIRKFEKVCSSLKEGQKNNYGFYWHYYVPYFIEMKDKQLVETFGYIAFASSEDAEVVKWLSSHHSEIDKFYAWSKAYVWKTN